MEAEAEAREVQVETLLMALEDQGQVIKTLEQAVVAADSKEMVVLEITMDRMIHLVENRF